MPQASIHGTEIFYEESGEGTPLIFLSGLGQLIRSWRLQVQYFAERGFRVVTFDTRGQGGSAKPDAPEAYRLSCHVEDLVGLMDHLSLERAHLVGLSHGGAVAQAAALGVPERILSLVLSDTTAHPGERLRRIFQGWIHAAEVGGNLLRFDVTLPWLFSERFIEANRPLIETLRELAKDPSSRSTVHLLRASLEHDLREEIGRITSPTLILCGALDLLTPPEEARILQTHIKGSILRILPDCGHVPPVEQPNEFNRAVFKFLTNRSDTR